MRRACRRRCGRARPSNSLETALVTQYSARRSGPRVQPHLIGGARNRRLKGRHHQASRPLASNIVFLGQYSPSALKRAINNQPGQSRKGERQSPKRKSPWRGAVRAPTLPLTLRRPAAARNLIARKYYIARGSAIRQARIAPGHGK